MILETSTLPTQKSKEIAALIETLNQTQKRLEELTAGEVDSIVDREGHAFFLRRAQEELRQSESARQAAILNALPAQVALLDAEGVIISVNESWGQPGTANVLQGPGFGVGQNYIEICEQVMGDCSQEGQAAARGIRQVLEGEAGEFSLEYPCHSPTEKCWFRFTVTPVSSDHLAGAVVMYVNISERMVADEQLRSKTALLEAQLDSTLDGILVVNNEGKMILQNKQMIDLWNQPADIAVEIDHRRRLKWITSQVKNSKKFSERVAQLYARPDEIARDELELINGKYLDRYTAPVIGRDGKHFGRIWVYRDITERRRAAKELDELSIRTARRERLLSTALASMSDFAQIYDQSGHILFVNQPLLDLWGLTLEEVLGKNLSELGYAPELANKLNRQLQSVFETGQEVTDETPYTSPTGATGYYEYIFSPALSAEGKVDFVVGSTRDVTQRKTAEVEIRFNEQRYRSLVQATTAIVWDTPASGEFTAEQPGWTAFTGQSFEELRGWGWLNAIHPEDRAETVRVWSAAIAQGSSYEVEHRMQVPDKTYRNMLVRGVPILGEDGAIRQWIGIHTDITERKKLEHQFLRAQRMESIGTLAGGVAHDLNNILAPILMSIEILKLTTKDPDTTEILKTIETSAKRGADIVRQVLSFARGLESQRIEVQPKHLLGDVESIIKGTFPKNIQFEISVPRDVWTIEGDPTQIHQILLNLSVNARDAMPNGGKLAVIVENCVLDEHYSAMNLQAKAGRYVAINVSDTGSGMPQRIIEKIFEPFFTTKELGKGTGLGLSTVMAIVKSHGGLINVNSEPGKGTTFKVYLPAMGNSSQTPEEDDVSQLPRGNGQTVLVIDDETSILTITGRTLRAFGYKSLTAVDGAEGVAMYAQNANDIAVVVTDMNMPIMNGMATIRALLRMNPMMKIVAASGLNVNGDAEKLAEMGVTNSLVKPYTAEALLSALHQILKTPSNAAGGALHGQ